MLIKNSRKLEITQRSVNSWKDRLWHIHRMQYIRTQPYKPISKAGCWVKEDSHKNVRTTKKKKKVTKNVNRKLKNRQNGSMVIGVRTVIAPGCWGLTGRDERTFWTDGNVRCLDWGGSFMGLYVCQNLSKCVLQISVLHMHLALKIRQILTLSGN